jgi:hypothetical protein
MGTFRGMSVYVTGALENCIGEDIFSFSIFVVLLSLKLSVKKMDEVRSLASGRFCFVS